MGALNQLVTPVFLAIGTAIPRRVLPSWFFANNNLDGDNKHKTVKDNIWSVYAKGYTYAIPRRVLPSRFFANNIEDGDSKDKTVKDNIWLAVTTSVYTLLEGRYAKGYTY